MQNILTIMQQVFEDSNKGNKRNNFRNCSNIHKKNYFCLLATMRIVLRGNNKQHGIEEERWRMKIAHC
jgi:hypothetical protein